MCSRADDTTGERLFLVLLVFGFGLKLLYDIGMFVASSKATTWVSFSRKEPWVCICCSQTPAVQRFAAAPIQTCISREGRYPVATNVMYAGPRSFTTFCV